MAETDPRHAAYRASRTILTCGRIDESARMTVFVGLYDSLPYFDHLVAQIEAQTAGSVRWLFVDNASSDETWARLNEWSAPHDRDVTIVRNGFNLGATGSIFVNLDLVTTEWVTFIHQDDIYLPHHLSTLANAAETAGDEIVGVFSDMARADRGGRAIGSFPPLIWMLPDLDPPTVFLALVRNHCIPWSALAVRTQVFRETEAPWHSTAFPDTEITLRLAGRGRFLHIQRETMRYRDNTASESRSIDDRERKFGATVSLFRVVNSGEFADLARSISPADRSHFASGLVDSLAVRLGATDRAQLVTAGALERLEQLWDDTDPVGLAALAGIYGGLGATATAGLLDRMAHAAGNSGGVTPIAHLPAEAAVTGYESASLARAIPPLVIWAYERLGHLLPYRVRRAGSRIVVRIVTRNNPLSAWRFEWR